MVRMTDGLVYHENPSGRWYAEHRFSHRGRLPGRHAVDMTFEGFRDANHFNGYMDGGPGPERWCLGITVEETECETASIRGVAFAGEGFSPKIVINLAHAYNSNEDGKRFTIGHELCHILFDRTRARRIAHVSGSWAPPGIEKRANAFAAYLLMPRDLIMRNLGYDNRFDSEEIWRLADILHVNESPLVEHLYNIDLIDEFERDRLRMSIGRRQ